MKVLVVGGGGREHALVWKLRQSPRVEKIYCAPGNAGIAREATCVPIKAEDVGGLREFALREGIDLTVVGPEAPLVAGLADSFAEAGLRVFGPVRRAALLEGSKVFAKQFMARLGIPTARFAVFRDPEEAKAYIRRIDGPCVVKADGLAGGKGTIVAGDAPEALAAVHLIMEERVFGEAGAAVVVEERLEGEEVSVLAFTDGKSIVPMVPSQDHKRAYDGDQGPNTGGMGAYSPPPVYTPEVHSRVQAEILAPLVRGLQEEGISYQGVIYVGLMLTAKGPYVLEFNCRFGDPEAQVVVPRLESDLLEVLLAVVEGRLGEVELRWDDRAAVCVVLASGGYPGPYETGKVITGLADVPPDVLIFHAGTAQVEGRIVTSGGRVLGVTGFGKTVREAVGRAYAGVEKISFEGMHYRRDIAHRALAKEVRSSYKETHHN